MDKFGLIGWPCRGSQSPLLFRKAYDGKYTYDFIEKEDFSEAWGIFMNEPYRAVNVTAPHKLSAALAADLRSEEVNAIGAANILVKTDCGVKAYNSDFLGVRHLIGKYAPTARTAAVVGFGGAGKAAFEAARSCGLEVSVIRHDALSGGAEADLVIFTLPKAADGMERIHCDTLIEANYRHPECASLAGVGRYIGGTDWLYAQALLGYELMTGEIPNL